MASLVIPTSVAAGAPGEQAATARPIRATKTQRMLADLTVVDSFCCCCSQRAFYWARCCRRRRAIGSDNQLGPSRDQAAVGVAEHAGQATARHAENHEQQYPLDCAGRSIRQILVHG